MTAPVRGPALPGQLAGAAVAKELVTQPAEDDRTKALNLLRTDR